MPARRFRARLATGAVVGLVVVGGVSCRSKSKSAAAGGPAGSASAAVAASYCRRPAGDSVVLLGSSTARAVVDEREESENEEDVLAERPFSVELGEARAGEGAFAVPAIETRGSSSFAILALVDASSGEARVADLGRVFGDVDPPIVTPVRDRWLVAVPNSDAGGITLRLAVLSAPYGASDIQRGPEVTSVRRDLSSAALLVRDDRGLLVWNTLEKGQARLAAVQVAPNGPKLIGEPRILPAAALTETEGPRLARSPSGYYLGYLSHTQIKDRRPLRADDADSGVPENLVEGSLSSIEILPLDESGAPSGAALTVTPARTQVLAFDLAPLGDGSVIVTYREARGPGLDRPTVQVVRVRADGTLERSQWDVGESAGLPTLLVDPAPPSAETWASLAILDERRTSLASIAPDTLVLGELRADKVLGSAEPLALRAGRYLTALPRGTQRELALLECGGTVRR